MKNMQLSKYYISLPTGRIVLFVMNLCLTFTDNLILGARCDDGSCDLTLYPMGYWHSSSSGELAQRTYTVVGIRAGIDSIQNQRAGE